MQPPISCEVADLDDPELRKSLSALAEKNYGETGHGAIGLILKIDWAQLQAATEQGLAYVLVARQAQDVVGYATVWVAPHTTYCGQVVAQCTVLYVESRARRSGAGLALIRKMTAEAKDRGADVFLMGCPLDSQANDLFERLGWQPVDVVFAKQLR